MGMSPEITDRELLCSASTDPLAFEIFYRRHVDLVVRFVTRRVHDPADVADVVADTFVAVLRSARSYDPDRGEPTAWLLGVAAKVIANRGRRRLRESALQIRLAGRRLIDADDIERLEEQIQAAQSSAAVMEAISRLKPRAQEVLLLVGVEGLTHSEAASTLGISGANFRMRLSSARRALARALPADDTERAGQLVPHQISPASATHSSQPRPNQS